MLSGSAQLQPTQVVDSEPSPEELMARWGRDGIPPRLPRSSHLRNKRNGSVYPWMEQFARRSDLYENCDERGNTDPEAWDGTKPLHQREGLPQAFAPLKAPEGFREAASTVLDSKASLYGQYLPDTLEGTTQKDLRESALPVPVVDASMTDLLDTLISQVQGRWQETPDEPEKPAGKDSSGPKRKRSRS